MSWRHHHQTWPVVECVGVSRLNMTQITRYYTQFHKRHNISPPDGPSSRWFPRYVGEKLQCHSNDGLPIVIIDSRFKTFIGITVQVLPKRTKTALTHMCQQHSQNHSLVANSFTNMAYLRLWNGKSNRINSPSKVITYARHNSNGGTAKSSLS